MRYILSIRVVSPKVLDETYPLVESLPAAAVEVDHENEDPAHAKFLEYIQAPLADLSSDKNRPYKSSSSEPL